MATSTIKLYAHSLALFEEFAKGHIVNVQDVTREDMFRFSLYLREERKRKVSRRTASGHFRYMIIFLKAAGVHLHIPVKQWVREPPKRKPRKRTPKSNLMPYFSQLLPRKVCCSNLTFFPGCATKSWQI